MPPAAKAALLANLAFTHPARKNELLAFARRLNVVRLYPYHLIERASKEAP